MADSKLTGIQVKHIDGVMHLTVNKPEPVSHREISPRFEPPVPDVDSTKSVE